MITTKQRAFLKAISHDKDVIEHIGQNGLCQSVLEQIKNAIAKNELIKIKVLENCPNSAKEIIVELCQKLDAEPVLCIGRVVVIYKKSTKKGVKHLLD